MKVKKIVSLVIVATSIIWGCNQSSSGEQESNGNEQSPKKELIKAPERQEAPSGEADKYGRKPGEEHYGHDHAPQGQQQDNQAKTQQDTVSVGVDQFGRKPGDEHYGHTHQ